MEIFDRVSACVSMKYMKLCEEPAKEALLETVNTETGVAAENTTTGQWLFVSDLESIVKINTILHNYATSVRTLTLQEVAPDMIGGEGTVTEKMNLDLVKQEVTSDDDNDSNHTIDYDNTDGGDPPWPSQRVWPDVHLSNDAEICAQKKKPSSGRTVYSKEFKLKVISYAEEHSSNKAAKQFNVNDKCVRRWRKIKNVLLQMPEDRVRITRKLNISASTKPEMDDNLESDSDSDVENSENPQIDCETLAEASTAEGRKSYTVSFKLAVVEFAELNNNHRAAQEFGVDDKCVRSWRQDKERLQSLSAHKRKQTGAARIAKFPELEAKLKEWLLTLKEEGKVFSLDTIKMMATQLSSQMGVKDFPGSFIWVKRFLKRSGLESMKNDVSRPVAEETRDMPDEKEAALLNEDTKQHAGEELFNAGVYEQMARKEMQEMDSEDEIEQEDDDLRMYLSDENDQEETVCDGLKCKRCDFVTQEYTTFQKHMEMEHNEINIMCPVCDKVFTNSSNLKQHMPTHTREPHYHICEICNKVFNCRKYLRQHIRGHARRISPPSRIPCDLCNQLFASTLTLKRHVDFIHKGLAPPRDIQCDICGKKFGIHAHFTEHRFRHKNERPFPCKDCDGRYKTRQELKVHISYVHENKRAYVCDFCGKSFHNTSGLKKHVQTHTGETNYTCEQCGKKFIQKHSLERHRFIHTGERPFSCQMCGDKFNDPGILRRHVMGVHKMLYSIRKGIYPMPDKDPRRGPSKRKTSHAPAKQVNSEDGVGENGCVAHDRQQVTPTSQDSKESHNSHGHHASYPNTVHTVMSDWARANEAFLRYNVNPGIMFPRSDEHTGYSQCSMMQ